MKHKLLRLSLLSIIMILCGGNMWAADKWIKTDPTELQSGDIVAIVDLTTVKAMSNDKGTSSEPTATAITLNSTNDEVTAGITDALKWKVTIATTKVSDVDTRAYKFSSGSDSLYCTNSNNGVRVGKGNNNTFIWISDANNANSKEPFLFNTGQSRYVGVNGGTGWRCYTSINNNIKSTVTAIYKKVEVASSVADPTFSPAAGIYYQGQEVQLNCATADADIYYSTDGVNFSKYSSSFPVMSTTTIYAYAQKNEEKSSTVSATYTIGSSYDAFKDMHTAVAADGFAATPVQYRATGGMYVAHIDGNNAYLIDGEGNGLLAYNKEGLGTLAVGQKMNYSDGYLTGTLTSYQGNTEITGIVFPEMTGGTVTVTPAEKSLPLTSANQSQLVTLKGLTYNATDKTLSDGTNTITYYDKFKTNATIEDGKTYDVTGIVVMYVTNTSNTIEICPRTAADITEASAVEPFVFRDIKFDLTEQGALTDEEYNSSDDLTAKILIAENEEMSRDDNATNPNATISGHPFQNDKRHGWSNFKMVAPVTGKVKITIGGCQYNNSNKYLTVTPEGGEAFTVEAPAACYHSDKTNNRNSVYYDFGDELVNVTFNGPQYTPYIAVVAVDEIPTTYTVAFAAGEGTGPAPASVDVNIGDKITAPKNYTLYKEGYTLTGWTSGDKEFLPGSEFTPEENMTLTAKFTQNEVNLKDREDAVTITFNLDGYNDNPKYNFQSGENFIVTQATVNGKTIDVQVHTNGKFAHNGSGWHQVNTNTTVTVPSCKGATFSVKTYQDANSLKFGNTAATSGATATYTATEEDATLVITQTANGYWNNLTITLPKVEEGGDDPIVNPGESNLEWDYTEKNIPTTSPDNGLYYGGYVNDAVGTNNGLHGVKLNGTGYAWFAKNPVEGTLTLTFGPRKNGSSTYAVNVYACTIDGTTATKGALIGEITVADAPGTGSLDIPAEITGIYIERKTSSEGVLQKIVFKEKVARSFTDFEIPYSTLKAEGYTGAGLPTGVSFSGTFHDAQHGYNNATMVVPTDGGAVKFTISGCKYGNTFPIKNANNETLANLNQIPAGCYDSGGTLTYYYTGDATTLTFGPIGYLAYFKAEAVNVQDVIITYKDQDGNKLGEKTVLEGTAIGETPYTEANLTIPEGYKFRGWIYTNGVKIKDTDIVNSNTTVKASVTAIEPEPTVGSVQNYDLTNSIFYPEDHENFDVINGNYYNSHGFSFNSGGSFSIKVAGKAQIILTLCEFGNGTNITVTDAASNIIANDVPAKAATGADGSTTTVKYTGNATTLTFTFDAQAYLHKVTVYNVNDFIEKETETGWFIVPQGDGAGFILAANSLQEGDVIFLPNGTYDLGTTALTTISKNNVSIIGESMEGVIIKNRPEAEGIGITATLLNTSTGLYMQDLTLDCVAPYGSSGANAERGVALQDKGTNTILKNVYLKGRQDTYYCNNNNGQYYFEDGKIEGTVDYICGNGDVFFNRVTLYNAEHHNPSTGDCITAPNTKKEYGYIFNNCTIDGVDNQAGKYSLGRPWAANTQVIYLKTKMNILPLAAGWTDWSPANAVQQFAEYGSVDANGDAVDVSSRKTTFNGSTNVPVITQTEAAAFTLDKVFAGWAPNTVTEQTAVTSVTLENNTLSWPAANNATMYMVTKNGAFLALTNATTFAINEAQGAKRLGTTTEDPSATDTYAIRAANGKGGFGEAVAATIVTGINGINADTQNLNGAITEVYTLNGARLAAPQKGVNIVKVKTADGTNKTMKMIVK